jgi:hypothetical protein
VARSSAQAPKLPGTGCGLDTVATGCSDLRVGMTNRARLSAPVALIALVCAVGAQAASAPTVKPQSGTYKGTLVAPRTEYLLTLTVKHGKLTKATASNIPLYCSSGGPAVPVKFGPSAISSRTGAFKTSGAYVIKVGPYKGKVGEKLQMYGRFNSAGSVSGWMKTSFVLNGPHCTGKSAFTATR